MRKPYGFKVIAESGELGFAFAARDWSILTAFDQFTHVSTLFKRLIGLDALEFRIGVKKHPVTVNRTKRFFMNQLHGVMMSYQREEDDLCADYQVSMPGYEPRPQKTIRCMYLGLHATASCCPGFCTLSAYDLGNGGATREIVRVDLRRFASFQVDDEKTIQVRRTPRENEIASSLEQMERIVGEEGFPAAFKIELIGGDT